MDISPDAPQVDALRAGEPAALERIVARWQRPLFAFAWRYVHNPADAEDLVIEAFARLHRQRARLQADSNLQAWLFTTLANLCHNHHRWRRRHPESSFEPGEETTTAAPDALHPASPDPGAALEADEMRDHVLAAIAALPHEQKTVLLLHHYDQLGYREIAAIVGCSERGVETRLYRARRQLRSALSAMLNESAPR